VYTHPDEAVVEDEADEGRADAAVGLDCPNDVPLDDILNAPTLLAVVPHLELAGFHRGHGGQEHRRLDRHQGADD
jgi:hypothetical protein